MRRNILLLALLVILMLACGAPRSVGFDAKQPPTHTNTSLPPLTPLPSEIVASPMPTLTPAAPTPGVVDISDPEAARQLMLFSHTHFKTLWADGVMNYYAGDGSTNPIQSERAQMWVALPDKFLALMGPANGAPERLSVTNGTHSLDPDGMVQKIDVPITEPFVPPLGFSDTIYSHPLAGRMGTPLDEMPLPSMLAQRPGQYNIVGRETFLDRPALVLEWSREPGVIIDRFWIDLQTGVLLRHLNFSKAGGGALNLEMYLTALLVDVPLPEGAFSMGLHLPGQFMNGYDDLPPSNP
ncbi:MAG: hypothetical protein AB1894_16270 [Chloroflexota bacterium]